MGSKLGLGEPTGASLTAWRRAGPGHGRVALIRRIVWLRALTAFIATHLGAELVEHHSAQHRYSLAEHLGGHPHRSFTAPPLAADSSA